MKKNLYAQSLADRKAKKLAKKVAAKKAEAALPVEKVPVLRSGGQTVKPVEVKPGVYAYDVGAPVLCAAGKHAVGHPSLPCEACADEEAAAVHRQVCIPAEDITQVQSALRSVRQFLELVKAPLVGSDGPDSLPVEQVIAEAKAAEAVLQDALIQSLKGG